MANLKAFDFESATLGEIDFIETTTGLPISEIDEKDAPKGKLLMAFATIIKRREDPSFTIVDAASLTMTDIQSLIGTEDDEDTTAGE